MGNKASKASDAYKIKLISDYRLGGGQIADVYKVQKKDTKEFYAAKFLKAKYSNIQHLENLGNYREPQTYHPFIIEYQDDFMY